MDQDFSTGLSPREIERLAVLSEEMGEAIQIIGKCLRHGLDSSHPDYGNVPNRALLTREIGHVLAAVDMLAGMVSSDGIAHARSMKHETVRKFLHF